MGRIKPKYLKAKDIMIVTLSRILSTLVKASMIIMFLLIADNTRESVLKNQIDNRIAYGNIDIECGN